jgi:hypothetical protein
MEREKRHLVEHGGSSQESAAGVVYPSAAWDVMKDGWRKIGIHEGMVEVEKDVWRLAWTR